MSSKIQTKHTDRAKLGCRATDRIFIRVLLVFILPFFHCVTNEINTWRKTGQQMKRPFHRGLNHI